MPSQRTFVFIWILLNLSVILVFTYIYRDDLLEIFSIAFNNEIYSYIIAIPLAVSFLIYIELKKISFGFHSNINTITYGILFILLVFESYLLSIITMFNLQFRILLYIFTVWLHIILIIGADGFKKLFPAFILSLFLAPLPESIIYNIGAYMSHVIAFFVERMGLAKTYFEGGNIFLRVTEEITFNLGLECSGAIGFLSSIIGLIVVISLITNTNSSRKKKFIVGIIISLLFPAIMFIGNIIRVSLVLYVSKIYNDIDLALQIFHHTPSIVYTIIATFISLSFIFKTVGKPTIYSGKPSIYKAINKRSIILLILFTPVLLTFTPFTPFKQFLIPNIRETYIPTIEEIMEKPRFIPEPEGWTIYSERKRGWESSLGATFIKVYYYSSLLKYLYLYVELSDVQSALHPWETCIAYRTGGRIYRVWNDRLPSGRIAVGIEFGDYVGKGLLIYFRSKIPVRYGNVIKYQYIKITVITYYKYWGDRGLAYKNSLEFLKYIDERLATISGGMNLDRYAVIIGLIVIAIIVYLATPRITLVKIQK